MIDDLEAQVKVMGIPGRISILWNTECKANYITGNFNPISSDLHLGVWSSLVCSLLYMLLTTVVLQGSLKLGSSYLPSGKKPWSTDTLQGIVAIQFLIAMKVGPIKHTFFNATRIIEDQCLPAGS